MPSPVRKVVVLAAVDGLILQPVHQRNQRAIQIAYKSHQIAPAGNGAAINKESESIDCHGIVGLLTVAPISYLVSITARQQVAQIRDAPIYVVTDVALIPLSSQKEASTAIKQVKTSLKKGTAGQGTASWDTDTDGEEHDEDKYAADDGHASPVSTDSPAEDNGSRPVGPQRSSSNVAEDVIGRKGQYGRFAERWFSRAGWSTERRRAQGMSSADAGKLESGTIGYDGDQLTNEDSKTEKRATDGVKESHQALNSTEEQFKTDNDSENHGSSTNTYTLLPKLLRTTRILLTSRSFFFSYDLDITRRLGTLGPKGSDLPLHKCVDQLFFWNSHLSAPLVEGGHHAFVLPLMQGFVGQRDFTIDKKAEHSSEAISNAEQDVQKIVETQKKAEEGEHDSSFLITLISRRSIKRPGLRYLRRGVDEEGNTANTVETEQIFSKASWADNTYSFTQMRGSIPLFFSQSPYAFKPVPVLQHSPEANQEAFKRHFASVKSKYGRVQIVLLVDKTGGEKEIGERYEASTEQLNQEQTVGAGKLGFEWFDFHNICRGMKFENVSLLTVSLGGMLDNFGETVQVDGNVTKRQSGVVRTNCMDCLDRTNVVQSAFGQRTLEQQLKAEGVEMDLRTDITTQWFNTLWADNGDAISKQYSSTAALKGDYTRTRQRNYRGAINDMGLTLTRYFNNIVNDYFSQMTIDYLLGIVSDKVFEDFEENMMSGDPGMSMQKVRENAVTTSSKIVVEDPKEEFVGGWTLLSPREPNTVRTFPLEEAVLLLTDAALYRVSFDWNTEKVVSSQRVDLRSITGVMKGVYITSILTASQMDEQRNVGFVVKYRPGKGDIARVNTRSLSSAVGVSDDVGGDYENSIAAPGRNEEASDVKLMAFKALPARSSIANSGQERQAISEHELVGNICSEIQRAASDGPSGATGFVESQAIVSLQEARKSTGLVEQWSHSLKRMVWG